MRLYRFTTSPPFVFRGSPLPRWCAQFLPVIVLFTVFINVYFVLYKVINRRACSPLSPWKGCTVLSTVCTDVSLNLGTPVRPDSKLPSAPHARPGARVLCAATADPVANF